MVVVEFEDSRDESRKDRRWLSSESEEVTIAIPTEMSGQPPVRACLRELDW